MTRKSDLTAGVFVIFGIALFGIGLFLIGDRRSLFRDNLEIETEFFEISGVESGATVRVGGMEAGQVGAVQAPSRPGDPFRLTLRVRADLEPLIRDDSLASIETEGLLGDRYVQIQPGTAQGEPLAEGATLQSREPFDVGTLLRKLDETADQLHRTVTTAKEQLVQLTESATAALETSDRVLTRSGDELRRTAETSRRLIESIEEVVASVSGGQGTLGKLLTDDRLYDDSRRLLGEIELAANDLRALVDRGDEILEELGGEDGQARSVLGDVERTVAAAHEVMSDLADSSESLKRNWFFRKLFKERGFYDLDELTAEEYRDGRLAETHDVHRKWLPASGLFAAAADGRESLTGAGKALVDREMADFLLYPSDSPLMVEGYARQGSYDQIFLAAQRRARLVRDYLVERFSLQPSTTGFLVLSGRDGERPPDREDGVALALYVDGEPARHGR
jgi:phospholipid/cholesterol/gamma-HCH transport system substrate-binding protein